MSLTGNDLEDSTANCNAQAKSPATRGINASTQAKTKTLFSSLLGGQRPLRMQSRERGSFGPELSKVRWIGCFFFRIRIVWVQSWLSCLRPPAFSRPGVLIHSSHGPEHVCEWQQTSSAVGKHVSFRNRASKGSFFCIRYSNPGIKLAPPLEGPLFNKTLDNTSLTSK